MNAYSDLEYFFTNTVNQKFEEFVVKQLLHLPDFKDIQFLIRKKVTCLMGFPA
jgi:hypothetical protein